MGGENVMHIHNRILFNWKEHTVSKIEKLLPENNKPQETSALPYHKVLTHHGREWLPKVTVWCFVYNQGTSSYVLIEMIFFFLFIMLAWLNAKHAIFPIESSPLSTLELCFPPSLGKLEAISLLILSLKLAPYPGSSPQDSTIILESILLFYCAK